jgi:hypothetical protein
MLKLIIVLMLIGVLGSLFSGLFFLYRDRTGDRLVKALTLRVALSIAIFIVLLLSYRFGLIPGYGH